MTDTKTPSPSDALLPCPFCGKAHTLIVGAASEMWDEDDQGPFPHTETYAVFCDASSEGGRGGCGGSGGYFVTKEDAIEAWNRRAPQAVAAGDLVACTYGDNGYACCEGGPCQAELHNEKIAAPPPQAVREPREMTQLEYERLQAISLDYSDSEDECTGFRDGWRAAEKHHGITKGGQHGAE